MHFVIRESVPGHFFRAKLMSEGGQLIPIALYLFSKVDLQTEGRTSWSLRRWRWAHDPPLVTASFTLTLLLGSKPTALASVIFGTFIVIIMSFPINAPVTISGCL